MHISSIGKVNIQSLPKRMTSLMQIPKNKPLNLPIAEFFYSKRTSYFYGYPKEYFNKPAMEIDFLESKGKGAGTRAIKTVVRESLKDNDTQGRVVLLASDINKTGSHPFLFYYKLGFRSTEDYYNDLGKKGLNIPAFTDTYMYLPKENIQQCLRYNDKANLKLTEKN